MKYLILASALAAVPVLSFLEPMPAVGSHEEVEEDAVAAVEAAAEVAVEEAAAEEDILPLVQVVEGGYEEQGGETEEASPATYQGGAAEEAPEGDSEVSLPGPAPSAQGSSYHGGQESESQPAAGGSYQAREEETPAGGESTVEEASAPAETVEEKSSAPEPPAAGSYNGDFGGEVSGGDAPAAESFRHRRSDKKSEHGTDCNSERLEKLIRESSTGTAEDAVQRLKTLLSASIPGEFYVACGTEDIKPLVKETREHCVVKNPTFTCYVVKH
ncbi:unnamed protein product, partial [Mesorhabditis spiculigera]